MALDAYPNQWENFLTRDAIDAFRLLVPGGWLVHIRDSNSSPETVTTTFVPDPDHHWTLSS